jgi:hypothetical protein
MVRSARERSVVEESTVGESLVEIEWHLQDAILDWNDVHREALRDVLIAEGVEEGASRG